MTKKVNKVLVIDDDKFMFKIISDCLQKEGYDVYGASDVSHGIEHIYDSVPDLILLDVVLPNISGYEICRMLRNDTRTSHIPIIMLTSRDQVKDKVAGLEAGADDYITKPFDTEELIARVKTHLRRAKQVKSFNPLTGLPGNVLIEEEIKERIEKKTLFSVLYSDLDNFKAYNDVYGFLKGDEVIKFVAHVLSKNIKELGNHDDFLGHIGGDDFIVITTPDKVEILCDSIIHQFDSTIRLFYNSEDRKRGYIISKSRANTEKQFPIMSLSIAVVSNENDSIKSHWQVSEMAALIKSQAKLANGSIYVKKGSAI